MNIYVIRHAEAVPLGENNIEVDADRPLTENGQAQAKSIGTALHRKGVALQTVLTSPLLRSRQTVEGMLKVWSGPPPQVEVCNQLKPGFKPRKLARLLRDFQVQQIALVGHEPDLSQWTAWLIGSKKTQMELAKAGVAHVQCEDRPGKGTGTLLQLLTPDWYG